MTDLVLDARSGALAVSTDLGMSYTAAIRPPRFRLSTLLGNAEPGFTANIRPARMWQDVARTAPVTAPGDLVASVQVQAGSVDYLTQATLADRPVYGVEPLGGRRNLFLRSEQFDNAAWLKQIVNVDADVTVAPDGTTTADRVGSSAASAGVRFVHRTVDFATSGRKTVSCYFKRDPASTTDWAALGAVIGGVADYGTFDVATGAVGSVIGANFGATQTITDAGDGWYRCALSFDLAAPGSVTLRIFAASGVSSISTVEGADVFIWGAQIETGSAATAYQRVGSEFDVTEAGKRTLHYLSFNGVNQSLVSPTITPATDKVQVFAGARRDSDAAFAILAEFSNSSSNTGMFFMASPRVASAGHSFWSRGVAKGEVIGTDTAAPSTHVLTGLGDIAANIAALRVDGVLEGVAMDGQGATNYLAYPLYIGARAGTSDFFAGRLYALTVRFGSLLTAAQIAQAEAVTAYESGISL